jgi:HSP20 family protein
MMTIVRRPSPAGELLSLRSAMDRLFEDSFVRPWTGLDGGSGLPLDVTATPDEIRVEASLPGFKPEDVEITVEDGTLTISGRLDEERDDRKGNYLLHEIRRGSFTRSVALPAGLEPDKASATFENGVLTLRIPKAEQVKPRQIRIAPTTDAPSTSPSGEDARPTAEPQPANAGA